MPRRRMGVGRRPTVSYTHLDVYKRQVAQDEAALLGESADLLFHLIVLLRSRGLALQDAVTVLQQRHK